MYNDKSVKKDEEMVESWKADTDRIVAFVSSYGVTLNMPST
jgi:hypothetical protein